MRVDVLTKPKYISAAPLVPISDGLVHLGFTGNDLHGLYKGYERRKDIGACDKITENSNRETYS